MNTPQEMMVETQTTLQGLSRPRFRLSLRWLVIGLPVIVAVVCLALRSSFLEARQVAHTNARLRGAVQVIEAHGGETRVSEAPTRWWMPLLGGPTKQLHVSDVAFSPHRTMIVKTGEKVAFPRSEELFAALESLKYPVWLNVRGTDFNEGFSSPRTGADQ